MSALHSLHASDAKPFEVAVNLGHTAGGSPLPLRFQIWGHDLSVVEVLDSWPGADHTYYKVRASDKAFYILRQDTINGDWTLLLYSKRKV